MATVTQRRMTASERHYVEHELADEESRVFGAGNAARAYINRFGYSAIAIGAVLFIVSSAAWELFGYSVLSLGLPVLGAILLGGLALSALAALILTVSFFRSVDYDPEDAEDARDALADGLVIEETHEIIDAKQVVMEDKDGLTYFLLTLDNRVFYWEDEESEDLWCDDKSIYDSKARPRSRLVISTTAVGDIEFDIRFEGDPVPFKSGMRFLKGAEDEFDCDEFIDAIIWDDIEHRYTRAYPKARDRMT